MSALSDNALDRLEGRFGRNLDYYYMEENDIVILRLDNRQIGAFDAEWLIFTKLKELTLNYNRIKKLPAEIFRLSKLDELNVAHNRLQKLPANIVKLACLAHLDLSDNELVELPDNIGCLGQLRAIFLGGNKLTEIPASIGQLKYLTRLSLAKNALTSIPKEIGYLSRLKELDLSGNQLTHLPVSLGSLQQLTTLRLGNNPLADPLPDLVQRGRDAVLTYLRSVSDAVPQYEAKVLLVGEGNVGKSCLIDALAGEPFEEGRETTHGIRLGMLRLPYPNRSGTDLTLNSWDFGGQELYRITHQFFYSKRSIYLLVWRPREGVEESAVADWLERIRLRVGEQEARILVVSTYAGERRADIDAPGLMEKFGHMIRGFYEVNNKTGQGIEKLKSAIAQEAAQLPQMGSLMNPAWIAARDEVCGLSETNISKQKLVEICHRHGLDVSATTTLADLMHDLGRIIYYSEYEGLEKLVVLKPEWLTRAISFVLEDDVTAQDKGILQHERLKAIWNDPKRTKADRYPAKLHPYFLRLMEKFDISYRYEDRQESLVGQMVPYERPAMPDFDPQCARLALVYELETDAPGLMPWLIVRTHPFSPKFHWRRGVRLSHQEHAALIELDSKRHRLELSVYGPSPAYFFHLLMDVIQRVMERWPGLQYERLIPCRSTECREQSSPGQFKLSTLERARLSGRDAYPCDRCLQDGDVSELLTGFATVRKPVLDELLEVMKRLDQRSAVIAADTALINELLDVSRAIRKGLSSELRDGPGLFTVWPSDEKRWWQILKNLTEEEYELWLWCDHPDCLHPVKKYTTTETKKWLQAIAPYINLTVRFLKLAIPVFGAVIAEYVPKEFPTEIKPKIDLMERFANSLAGELKLHDVLKVEPSGLTSAQGAAVRALHATLRSVDPHSEWGGLRRVQNAAGDTHWVCRRHYHEYDAGLPNLPT